MRLKQQLLTPCMKLRIGQSCHIRPGLTVDGLPLSPAQQDRMGFYGRSCLARMAAITSALLALIASIGERLYGERQPSKVRGVR